MANIILQKQSQRALSDDVIANQLSYAVQRALGGNRGRVWAASKPAIAKEENGGERLYTATIKLRRTGKRVRDEVAAAQIERMREMALAALRSKGWTAAGQAVPNGEQIANGQPAAPRPPAEPVQINMDRGNHFGHLFGLDDQIDLVLSSVEEYRRSEHNNRFHVCLFGSPACGKTEILRSLTRMVGQEAVMHFDATSTTAAGAKQLLIESANMPPILCIEEIEKADEQSLRWLLGVMDYRAEIRQVKFRTGMAVREVKLLCLATVNDLCLFNRMMDGALASRFSHKVNCPRPSREVLERILHREIDRNGGNPAWIKPALDYCVNEEKTNDPRRIITVCLCGRDQLLTGEYQKVLAATRG
jgi:hypothetical protein